MRYLSLAIVLASCKRGPAPAVECSGFDRSLGFGSGTFTIVPETVFKWTCADKKERSVTCHIQDDKHACTCKAGQSTDAKFEVDGKLPEKEPESRTFANQLRLEHAVEVTTLPWRGTSRRDRA